MSLTTGEIWPMIAGSAVVIYGAGHYVGMIVTKIQNGRHVTKEFCTKQHELTTQRFNQIMEILHEIKYNQTNRGNHDDSR